MKKTLLLLFVALFAFAGCSTINQSKFLKSNNAKETIVLKYGQADKIENKGEFEIWEYEYKSALKSDRKVIFDENNNIVLNEKHLKPIPYVFRYTVLYGVLPITIAVGMLGLLFGSLVVM